MNALCSEHLTISNEYEVVFLDRKEGSRLIVGDHYGDPEGAFISESEQWVMSYGEGIQVYFLQPPFRNYSRSGESHGQWKAWLPAGGWSVTSARVIEVNTFEVSLSNNTTTTLRVAEIHRSIIESPFNVA